MRHLFLFGGGEAPHCNALDRILISKVGADKKILYIPVADEDGDFLAGFKYFKGSLEDLGHTQFDMWISLYNKTYRQLKEYGAVYLAGGNTYLLNKLLKSSGFSRLLKRYAEDGYPIYGDSAGAIVLGNDIRTAAMGDEADDDIIGSPDYRGLNIFENITLHCHYEPSEDQDLLEISRNINTPIFALSEKAGLEVRGKMIRVIGNDSVLVFVGGRIKRFSPDSLVKVKI